jgi:hypothetical protein
VFRDDTSEEVINNVIADVVQNGEWASTLVDLAGS